MIHKKTMRASRSGSVKDIFSLNRRHTGEVKDVRSPSEDTGRLSVVTDPEAFTP